jgi:hypothetical protein
VCCISYTLEKLIIIGRESEVKQRVWVSTTELRASHEFRGARTLLALHLSGWSFSASLRYAFLISSSVAVLLTPRMS